MGTLTHLIQEFPWGHVLQLESIDGSWYVVKYTKDRRIIWSQFRPTESEARDLFRLFSLRLVN